MKLALVLLMSAVGFGQQVKPQKTVVAPCLHGHMKVGGDVKLINCMPPHKPKPSVKPEEMRKQWKTTFGGNDPCDGIACTGPVEMLPQITPVMGVSAFATAPDGSKMVLLSDSEYSHLQQLRASVVEEEKRLAVKYGADLDIKQLNSCAKNGTDLGMCYGMKYERHDPDHYEFHGQFLLVDRGGK